MLEMWHGSCFVFWHVSNFKRTDLELMRSFLIACMLFCLQIVLHFDRVNLRGCDLKSVKGFSVKVRENAPFLSNSFTFLHLRRT